MKIEVEARMDKTGNLLVRPTHGLYARKYARHMLETTGRPTYHALFTVGSKADGLLKDFPEKAQRDLRKGWPVRFSMDSKKFGGWLGHGARDVTLER